MSNQVLFIIMGVAGVIFLFIVIAFLSISKKMQKSEFKKLKQLQKGTSENKFSLEILYQKLYVTYVRIPIIKRYILKLRRKLEILDMDDEYKIRNDSAKMFTKSLLITIPVMILTIILTSSNPFLLLVLLTFEVFMIDTIVDSSVEAKDNKLMKEQLDFFTEIRHAYNESNMVEEAIYQISQDDEREISLQGERIYEILISDDPETELEKYYDVAPNTFLKEFAGLSYLTKEFGDRKVDGASLYLKNVNNITQEMQLEVLKRDKLNYVFKSLPIISLAPILILEPLKSWSITNFTFTESWYMGSPGTMVQIIILLITFVAYMLVKKLRDNGSVGDSTELVNPWQKRMLKKKWVNKIVSLFLPKKGGKEYRKVQQMLKDAASPLKMEWLYLNRIVFAVIAILATLIMFIYLHKVSADYVYNEPTTDYDLIGGLDEKDKLKAMEVTTKDNEIIDALKGNLKVEEKDVLNLMAADSYYDDFEETQKNEIAERILGKLNVINSEYIKWFEVIIALAACVPGYMAPIWLLMFQVKMRQIEMEDEVMQFQTIILMLMRIERVNVEIILEWLERYAKIFKGPITKCVNNYEAGAWEALEAIKDDVSYIQLIRIVESLQAAVEKIPIIDAFDELETEKDYYKEKRKESNERLIKRKSMIGKVIGFAPMVVMFVGYLIVPLVFIGMTSMTSSLGSMTAM